MWVLYAFGAALFAGITGILAKVGIKNTDSNVATALRTVVVFIFGWLIVWIIGSFHEIQTISGKTFLFLILSGFATGASWLCYFKALQLGEINKVTPIDKSSTILTMILAFIFLKEEVTVLKIICVLLIAIGTFMMIQKQKGEPKVKVKRSESWLFFALLAAVFAALTSILGKVGIEDIESNLGTAIRTTVVLVMAWFIVFYQKKQNTIKSIDKKSWVFLFLSGLATGASWLCFYKALQTGPASAVVPIDKLSIVITVIFSYVVFKEKLNFKSLAGLIFIVVGTLLLLV